MMAGNTRPIVALLQFTIFLATLQSVYSAYFGKFLGKLSELHHGVSGEVYAVDARTLYLKDFTYDGQGPAAYFYAGNSRSPGNGGFRLRDENGSPEVIRRYRREGVTLTLPEGKTLNNIKWFSVWCEEFAVNFGDVKIPRNFDYPRPRKIDALRGVHGISSDNIVIVDAQTLLVPNLSYDGEAPDAKFWVGRGPKPSPQGVRVPDENGKEVPLRRYDRKTVVLTLPGDLTVFDIGHFGIWCEAFTVDFGHTQIPQNLNVPPSLKMLGVSPQSKLNCEVLYDDLAFEVRWAVAGDSIVLQLVAKLEDREYMAFGISGDESKSAMVGGDVVVAWVDKDTLKGFADDYYLDAKSQCSGPTGSCPDGRLEENTNNIRLLNAAMVNGYSIVTYQRPLKPSDQFDRQVFTNESQPIIWAIGPLNQRNEVSFHSQWVKADRYIDFGRPAKWNCPMPETEQPPMKPAPSTQLRRQQYQEVTEAEPEYEEPAQPPPTQSRNQQRRRGGNRGAVRQESADSVAKDSERTVSRTRQSSRRGPNANSERNQPARQVPTPAPVSKRDAWEIPPIQCYEPEDGVLYAQMGPTGGKRGYPAITGHVGWGISWYINGLLIPEINVVRGKTYTFVVEGGLDPEVPAKYHPFYITDDPVGGYEYKTPEERAKIKIFAGARQDTDGTVHPTGTGRLCHWTHQGDSEADDFESFGAYQRTLELKCDQGEPGVIQFTPDRNTPDTVYYQCFTHRYLGWKINVLDSCDVPAQAASELKPSVVDPKTGEKVDDLDDASDDLEDSPSIRVETRVSAPNAIETKPDKSVNTTKDENLKGPQIDTDAPLILNTNEKEPEYPKNNYESIDISQVAIPNSYVQHQLSLQTEFPILLQPQSNYFPQPFYFQNPESPFSSNYNPLLYPNFNVENPQQSTFKPSPPMDSLSEEEFENQPELKFEQEKPIASEVSTPSSNTFSIITDKITTDATKETKLEPKSNPINKTTVILLPSRIPQGNIMYGTGKIIVSHPISSSPSAPVPYVKPYQFTLPPRGPSHFPFKKPYNRPMIVKPPLDNRPFPSKFQDKPMFLSSMQSQLRPQSVIFMKRPPPQLPQMFIKKLPPTYIFAEKQVTKLHPNVEISPLQASTEKEPRGTTEKPYAPLVYIAPSKVHYNNAYRATPFRPAINTGFHPESVIIEGGFKPIVSKEIQDRVAEDDGPELEYESEIGVIDANRENQDTFKQSTQSFGPMFIPSPLDKPLQNKTQLKMQKRRANKNNAVMFVVKQNREERRDVEGVEDEVAEAAERVDTFYLPPPNSRTKPVQHVMQPSNIDIPPGTVVTYDGKRVSGTSLTAKAADRGTLLEGRSSKAAALITKPQIVPFKGDLPPLDPKFITKNAPQLQYKGVLNRDLDAPSTSYLPQDSSQGSTKLVLIRQLEEHDKKEETHSRHERRKREAHHTPEHTAEQEAQAKKSQNNRQADHDHNNNSSSTVKYSTLAFVYANVILVFSIYKFL